MDRTLAYALLFAVPAGTAAGSGLWLMTRDRTLGLALGLGVGATLFVLVYLGGQYGSADERLADRP